MDYVTILRWFMMGFVLMAFFLFVAWYLISEYLWRKTTKRKNEREL